MDSGDRVEVESPYIKKENTAGFSSEKSKQEGGMDVGSVERKNTPILNFIYIEKFLFKCEDKVKTSSNNHGKNSFSVDLSGKTC